MISQAERDALRARINPLTDYLSAAEIYRSIEGRTISHRYLYKFLSGERIVTGKKPGSHQPLRMWEALIKSVEKREREAEEMTRQAKEMRERLAA